MPEIVNERILDARKAVDAYREAHRLLHQKPYYREVHDDHTPLLEKMKEQFKLQGFNSLKEFWDESDLLNIQELGFISKEDFELKATKADRGALEGKWR